MQHVDQQTLDSVINRTVSEAQVARIKEHVRVCRVCARRLEEYRDLFSEVEIIIPTAERDVIPKPAATKTWREVIRPRFDDAIPSSDKAIKIGAGIVAVLVIAVVIFLLRSPTSAPAPIVLQPAGRTPAAPSGSIAAPPAASLSSADPAPKAPATAGSVSGATTPSTSTPSATNPSPTRTTASLGSATPANLDPPKTSKPMPSAATPRRQSAPAVTKPQASAATAPATTPTTSVPPKNEGGHTPLFHRVESAEALTALGGSMQLIDGEKPDHYELAPGAVVPGAAQDLPVVRVIYKMNGNTILLDQQRHPEIASRETSSGTTPEGVSVVQWSQGDFWLTLAGRVPADTLELLARRIR